jgi:hypothetical protein
MIIFTPVVDVLILAGDSFFRVALYIIVLEYELSSFYSETALYLCLL